MGTGKLFEIPHLAKIFAKARLAAYTSANALGNGFRRGGGIDLEFSKRHILLVVELYQSHAVGINL